MTTKKTVTETEYDENGKPTKVTVTETEFADGGYTHTPPPRPWVSPEYPYWLRPVITSGGVSTGTPDYVLTNDDIERIVNQQGTTRVTGE